jgi:hypothetical protein
VYPDNDELAYRRGHFICGGVIAVSLIVTFILRICLKLENDRRIHLSPDNYKREAAITEPCDWVSQYLVFLFSNVVFSLSLASRHTLRVVTRKNFEG